MNTSFSALNTFRICPLKYKFQQVDKIKTKKSPEAVFGTLVHDTMRFIHTGGFTTPTLKEALNHFSTRWNADVFDDEMKERAAFAQGIRIIQEYYKKNDPAVAKIVGLELHFTIELEDEEKNQKHLVSGIIDRIDKTDEGFEIVDYKTSKKMPPQKNIDDNLQLLIYLFAFLKRYPKEEALGKINLSLYFLHHNTKLSTTKTKKELIKGKETIIEIIHKIASSDFPAIVNSLCNWCEFQKHCPMWKHKFKDVKSATDEEKKSLIREYIKTQENVKKERSKAVDLQSRIFDIMENEHVDRLFGENKIIAKTYRQTFAYDEEKLKEILQKQGLWEKALKLNQTQLRRIIEVLPLSVKKRIEKTCHLIKENCGLSVKKQ